MTVICCKCKRIRTAEGWRQPVGELDSNVSHSYCPPCALEARIELFSEQASASPHPNSLRHRLERLAVDV